VPNARRPKADFALKFTLACHFDPQTGSNVNQDRWKSHLEVIGVAAIVVSLAFVAFEIRQNTNAVRSTIIQSVSQQSFDGVALMLDHEYLQDAQYAARSGNADEKEIRQLDLYYVALMRVQLNRYMQSKIGVIDQELVLEVGGRSKVYGQNSFRNYWSRNRDDYSKGFQD
jgi:hypothetical protein